MIDSMAGPGNADPTLTAGLGADATAHRLAVRFTGSGSEYFRIWIVNLLLTVVTLGLYYPFAKLRRLRYFFGNTEVGGYPLSFHAQGRRMFLGYVLVAGLLGGYSLAGRLSPVAGVVAFALLALAWPALWHSALRFRMANTGWRGLRLGFVGTRQGAYKALGPGFALGFLFLFIGLAVQDDAAHRAKGLTGGVLAVFVLLALSTLLAPYLMWLMRRYQHEHYIVAAERSHFDVRPRSFYAMALRLAGLSLLLLLPIVLVFFVIGLVVGALGLKLSSTDPGTQAGMAMLYGLGSALVAIVIFQMLMRPYITSRMQNLVWNGTRSQNLRFESALRLRPLMWLTVKNWLLMIVTLGLYFPFAAVATARLRLQAVTVISSIDPDALMALPREANEAAAGEAAGDMFGIDIGL